jgi:hypothetical protein
MLVGIAQQNGRPSYGLCAQTGRATQTGCTVVDFSSNDARETTVRGDWDVGFLKGECGLGKYVKGVATDGGRALHSALCCAP